MLDYWVPQLGGGCTFGGPMESHWGESMPLERMTRPLVASSLLVHGADASSFPLLQLLPWPLSHTGPKCEASQAQTGTFKLWGKINLYKPIVSSETNFSTPGYQGTQLHAHTKAHTKKFKETLLKMAPRQKQVKYVPNRYGLATQRIVMHM